MSIPGKLYPILVFIDSSQVTMSAVLCAHSSEHLYTFDYHQQMMIPNNNNNKQREITTTSSNNFSNHLNEDELCQICGDLATGWHCG